jgi:hypothetical protein
MMLEVKGVPGVLVFMSTSTSTGSVDQVVCPKQTEQGKESKKKARSSEDVIAISARFRTAAITRHSISSFLRG